MRLRQILGTTLVLLVAVLALPRAATAGPLRLRVDDLLTGQGVVLSDNGPGDIQPQLGLITWSGWLLGSMTIDVTTGASKPIVGDGNNAWLDLNSISIAVGGPSSLRLTLEDTGWTTALPGETAKFVSQIGGTLTGPGTLTAQSWVNADNLVPNLGADTGSTPVALGAIGGTPAGSVQAFSPIFTTSTPGAFSAEDYDGFLVTGPFSVFSQVTINFTGPGMVSFDQAAGVPVPEPGTLTLLGTGLVAMLRKKIRLPMQTA